MVGANLRKGAPTASSKKAIETKKNGSRISHKSQNLLGNLKGNRTGSLKRHLMENRKGNVWDGTRAVNFFCSAAHATLAAPGGRPSARKANPLNNVNRKVDWVGERMGTLKETLTATQQEPAGVGKTSKRTPLKGGGKGMALPEAQLALAPPDGLKLHIKPGDGSCFFHCIKAVHQEYPLSDLRRRAKCRKGWAEDHHVKNLAQDLNLHLRIWPVALEAFSGTLDPSAA